jgi:hypothetical protein
LGFMGALLTSAGCSPDILGLADQWCELAEQNGRLAGMPNLTRH